MSAGEIGRSTPPPREDRMERGGATGVLTLIYGKVYVPTSLVAFIKLNKEWGEH